MEQINQKVLSYKSPVGHYLLPLALFLALLLLLPSIIGSYHINLATEILIFALGTMSFNLMMGYTGMVSLGHGAYFGVGAYAAGILVRKFGYPFWLAIPSAIIVTAVVAAIIGYFCVRIAEIYFVFITLAFSQMIYTITYYWVRMTGGDDGLPGINRPHFEIGSLQFELGSNVSFYYFTLLFVTIGVLLLWLITSSPYGKVLQAIRENRERVEFMGLNVRSYRYSVFILSSSFTGFAGSLYAFYQGFVSPDLLVWTKSAEFILMSLLGGIYTLLGPGIGAVIFIFLKDTILAYTESWKLVLGIALIVIILFSPGGVTGVFLPQWRRIFGNKMA